MAFGLMVGRRPPPAIVAADKRLGADRGALDAAQGAYCGLIYQGDRKVITRQRGNLSLTRRVPNFLTLLTGLQGCVCCMRFAVGNPKAGFFRHDLRSKPNGTSGGQPRSVELGDETYNVR